MAKHGRPAGGKTTTRVPAPLARRLLIGALALAATWVSSADAANQVPNPTFAETFGRVIGVQGTVPALWRAFAVNGGAASISIEALPANALFEGSPPTNAVRLTVSNSAGDQGFDHEDHRIRLVSGHPYRASVYLKSGNDDASNQRVVMGVPVFTEAGPFSGRNPGGFTATATAAWQRFSGPSFQEQDGTSADISFRVGADGGQNSVLIALPSIDGPEPLAALATPGRSYVLGDRYVAASFFHWYTTNGGQLSGPWRPLEGRAAWRGNVAFWRRQIMDIMDAGVDVLYVHLISTLEPQRIDFFRALAELRAEGFDVPRVAPFLDPVILWDGTFVDLSTTAGKDDFVSHLIRWYKQYFVTNTDQFAESYLLRIDGRAAIDFWHLVIPWVTNRNALTRDDVESRLRAAFPDRASVFANGIYAIGTENNTPPWFDERMHQFSNTAHFSTLNIGGVRTATMKPGYWDQNVRSPGIFLAREGGAPYRNAWDELAQTANTAPAIAHAYIESWNEYDEGTGVYSSNTGPPHIAASNTGGNNDVWSTTNNPREYIDTTSAGAAVFRGDGGRDAAFIGHNTPVEVFAGQPMTIRIAARNRGATEWTRAGGFALQQSTQDTFAFANGPHLIDDQAVETTTYGGVFRGRPVVFEVSGVAPTQPGAYALNWRMTSAAGVFGDTLTTSFTVVRQPVSLDFDGNGSAAALTDGLLYLRHLFGFTGAGLTNSAVANDCTVCSDEAIAGRLTEAMSALDVDANGQASALTDGLLVLRFLFGFQGTSLTDGAVDSAGTRTTPESVATYLETFRP